MTQDDQPRPDLDAALDAVLPSLTGVADDAAAASLRRTRTALVDGVPARHGVGAWRWSMAAAAALVVAATTLALWRGAADDLPTAAKPRAMTPVAPAASPPSPALAPPPALALAPPPAPAPPQARPRVARVTAMSTPASEPAARPDPLIALVRAMQEIPEESWTEGLARAQSPLAVPDVSLTAIVVSPLETPAIVETPAEPVAPGEP